MRIGSGNQSPIYCSRTKAASPRDVEFARRQRDAAREQLLGARETLAKLKQGYREEQVRAAEAQVKALEEKLKYYKQMLTLTEVRAPAGGVITTPYMAARKGQHTKVGDLIAVVQDKSKMQVEVAADDAAALDVHEGMPVHVRLYGTYGRLLCGRVVRVAPAAEQDGKFGNDTVRTDPETYNEQRLNNRTKSGNYHLRVYVELEDYPPNLTPEMYGYARIVVDENDVFWRAIARPVVRFLRTEVWYWLP